jgi:hypothetical protein
MEIDFFAMEFFFAMEILFVMEIDCFCHEKYYLPWKSIVFLPWDCSVAMEIDYFLP